MPKGKDKRSEPAPPHTLLTDEQAREILEVEEVTILQDRVNELANLLWRHENMSEEQVNTRVARAIEHFNSLKPSDGAEGMLAQQMVGTHFAALDCLRRAAIPVEKGGRAIVGNVETGRRNDADNKPPELEHKPDDAMPLDNTGKAKVRRSKRK